MERERRTDDYLRSERKTGGYAGRWKRWALIYLGVAAVVYLVIYLAVSAGGGYGG